MRKTMQIPSLSYDGTDAALEEQLSEACRLYNAALQERRDAYHQWHIA